jgi:hypothetical protein
MIIWMKDWIRLELHGSRQLPLYMELIFRKRIQMYDLVGFSIFGLVLWIGVIIIFYWEIFLCYNVLNIRVYIVRFYIWDFLALLVGTEMFSKSRNLWLFFS